MMRKDSGYTFGEYQLSYEVQGDGYDIYFGDTLTLSQRVSHTIPYPALSYGAGAMVQIKELCGVTVDLEEEIKNEKPLSAEEQGQLDMALNLEYLVCLEELKA